MKHPLQRSRSPKRQLSRRAKVILLLLRLTGFALGGIIILALFHLLAIGLPKETVQKICRQARKQGVQLHVESIRLFPHRGWALQNVQVFNPSPDIIQPLLQTKTVYVNLLPVDWRNLKNGSWHIFLNSRDLDLSLGPEWDARIEPDRPLRTIDRLQAKITIQPSDVTVDSALIRWGAFQLAAQGWINRPEEKTPPDKKKPVGLILLKQADRIATTFESIHWKDEARIDVSFDIDPQTPEKNRMDASLVIEEPGRNDTRYERLTGELSLHGHTLLLSSLKLANTNGAGLTVSGLFDTTNQMARLDVDNTFDAEDLIPLLPESIRSALAQWGLKPYGPLDVHATFGPARPPELLKKINADVRLMRLARNDLKLDPLSFKLERNNEHLECGSIQATANGGDLAGHIEVDLPTKAWLARVDARCAPHPVGNFFGGGLQEFFNRFTFPTDFPEIKLTLSHGGKGTLTINGTLSGENFICADVPMDRLQAKMLYSKRILELTALDAEHGDKRFKGEVQVDFNRGISTFDAASSFAPPAIAHILAPGSRTILDDIQFNGPFYAKGRGEIDFKHKNRHTYEGELRAEQVSFKGYETSIFKSTVLGHGPRLLFTNSTMQVYGGLAEGSAEFDLFMEDGTSPYRLRADIAQIDLPTFLNRTTDRDHSQTLGTFSTTIDLTADASCGFWKTADGRGSAKIEKGRLANLPLLGGFSRFMRTSIPGFKLFSITTLRADFEINGGFFRSERIELGGDLLSARARGKYAPESGLDFLVRAEPLRQTRSDKNWYQAHLWAADAVKWGASPLFRFFEFKLSGSLENPKWHFVNLPTFLQRSKTKKPTTGQD